MTSKKAASIQQLKASCPYFFSVLEDFAEPAINDFLSRHDIHPENHTKIIVSIDVKVLNTVKTSASVRLYQDGVYSQPLYETDFYDSTKESDERHAVVLLVSHLGETVFPDPSNLSINFLLPNANRCSSLDLATEIKRTVEWYYSISAIVDILDYRESFQEDLLDWKEIAVRMGERRKITILEAQDIIKNHLRELINPYFKIVKLAPLLMIQKPSIEPMEQALILRMIAARIERLKELQKGEVNELLSYIWSSKNVATLKSKFELFQKYLSLNLLNSINYGMFSGEDIDIFSITEVLYHDKQMVEGWIKSHDFTDDELEHVTNTYGNEGYRDNDHYQSAVDALGQIFKHSQDYWKERINRFVFDVSEIEEIYGWSVSSGQPLPSLAMQCIYSDSKKFKAFGKGVLLQNGLTKSVPFITNANHARSLCRLFNTSPYVLMSMSDDMSESTQSAIAELIVEGS